jgi:hypothetical protein
MSDRQRLPLLAAIIVAAFSAPDPSAQTGEVMTPVPLETARAAMPQGVPDAACVARCGAQRDRSVAEADLMLAGRKYFSGFSSNCWSGPPGSPQCAMLRQTCRDACAPKYDNACMAACEASFQSCCASNARVNAAHYYDVCVVECPASKAAVPPPPPPPPGGDQSKGATIDRESEWTSLIKVANSMLDAVGLDKLDSDQFNDMRRTLAFLQVRASMALHGSKYTVVSGGAGRLWLLTADGKQVLLNATQSDMVRGPAQGEWHGAEYQNTLTALTTLAGVSPEEAKDCINQVRLANQRQRFGAGETLEFPPWQGWPAGARASSEHSTIRGTINGGGDFI